MPTPSGIEIVPSNEVGQQYNIYRGMKLVGSIVHNGDGWRACYMPGLKAFSPVGMDELSDVKAYAVREFQKEAA